MSLRSAVGSSLRAVGLESVATSIVRAETGLKERRAQRRWRRHLLAAVTGPDRPMLVTGELDDGAIPVIACLWNRPDRIHQMIDLLSAQTGGVRLRLLLWNNKATNSPEYERVIAEKGATGALASIEFHSADYNLGGIARFVMAHQLVRDGYRGPYITFDDDQDVTPSFITDLLAYYAPNTCAGQWAWTYRDGNYWDRTPAEPGERADYVGTPGAVFDTSSVEDPEFFQQIPPRFGFIEDLWSSYWIRRNGGTLLKAETSSVFVQEELNQSHALFERKLEFGAYLRDLGYQRDF